MPNSNPYTPHQNVSPNGTPAPDTANTMQPPSAQSTQPGCQAGAAGSATPMPCGPAPVSPNPQPTTATNPQCSPGMTQTPTGKPCS
jgi:hypothetical protein